MLSSFLMFFSGEQLVDSATSTAQLAFWDTTSYRYPNFGNTVNVADGLGGTIGVTYNRVDFDDQHWQSKPDGKEPIPDDRFPTGEIGGYCRLAGRVRSITSVMPRLSAVGTTNSYSVTLNFSNYKASAARSRASDGATCADTHLALSRFFNGSVSGFTKISVTGTTLTGEPIDLARWTLYNSGALPALGLSGVHNARIFLDVASRTISGRNAAGAQEFCPEPPDHGNRLGSDTGLGLFKLPNDQRYTTLTLTFKQERVSGGPNPNDLHDFYVATDVSPGVAPPPPVVAPLQPPVVPPQPVVEPPPPPVAPPPTVGPRPITPARPPEPGTETPLTCVPITAGLPDTNVPGQPAVTIPGRRAITIPGRPAITIPEVPDVVIPEVPDVYIPATPSVTILSSPHIRIPARPSITVTSRPSPTVAGSQAEATIITSGVWLRVTEEVVGGANLVGVGTQQINWGTVVAGQETQSGYRFDGVTANSVSLSGGAHFDLGTFTHYNYEVTGYTIRSAVLTLTLQINHGTAAFNFQFGHNETANQGVNGICPWTPGFAPPCPDVVTVLNLQSQETVKIGVKPYALCIAFLINDQFSTQFVTLENQKNTVRMRGYFVAAGEDVRR